MRHLFNEKGFGTSWKCVGRFGNLFLNRDANNFDFSSLFIKLLFCWQMDRITNIISKLICDANLYTSDENGEYARAKKIQVTFLSHSSYDIV